MKHVFIFIFIFESFDFLHLDGIINYYQGSRPEPTHLAFMDGGCLHINLGTYGVCNYVVTWIQMKIRNVISRKM